MGDISTLVTEVLNLQAHLLAQILCFWNIVVVTLSPCTVVQQGLLTLHSTTSVYEGLVKYLQGSEVLSGQICDPISQIIVISN